MLKDITAHTLLDQTIKGGSLVYTDKCKGHDTLLYCGYRHLQVDHGRTDRLRFARAKVQINGLNTRR